MTTAHDRDVVNRAYLFESQTGVLNLGRVESHKIIIKMQKVSRSSLRTHTVLLSSTLPLYLL